MTKTFDPETQNARIEHRMERAMRILDEPTRAYVQQLKQDYPAAYDELASINFNWGNVALVWAIRAMLVVAPVLPPPPMM